MNQSVCLDVNEVGTCASHGQGKQDQIMIKLDGPKISADPHQSEKGAVRALLGRPIGRMC